MEASEPAESVVVIAMERGSSWPHWVQTGHDGTLVLAQQPSEGAAAFAQRVVRRIARLGASGKRLGKAVLAVTPGVTPESVAGRYSMVRALLRTCSAEDANVVLSVPGGVDDDARHDLFALLETLSEHLHGAHSVGLCFGAPLPRLRRCGAGVQEPSPTAEAAPP